ncbi:MAG: hypothetical protein QOD86_3036 [Miltoncostaeaceae bacterium]|jgi:hypothetical protein|nr:hypothetical protein [Miltoncostaeaceae bacterium]
MSTTTQRAGERIAEEVTRWPGVSDEPGRFGARSFVLGRRELGHVHGDHAAHFAFPRAVKAELERAGRVGPHPAFPDSPGWAARRITSDEDVRDVIALMRLNYDRMAARHGVAADAG